MMELREQIARAICGNWIVGDDRPWQQWTEEADAVLEVLAKQEPVAWFEKSPEFDAWFVAYSCNPKAETRPLYLAPGAVAAVPDGWRLVPIEPAAEMLDAAEKLDWSNEDVRGNCCNQWHVMLAAAPKPEGK